MPKIIFLGFLIFLTSCGGDNRSEFRMEVGKKYPLQEWPSQAFIDTLDLYVKAEPVKKRGSQAAITMELGPGGRVETVDLENSDETKLNPKIKKMFDSVMGRLPQETSASETPKKAVIQRSFADRFVVALGAAAANPRQGMQVAARQGETLEALLVRTYGAQARTLPQFLVHSQIERLNPSVDFQNLRNGEMVILPRVK
jgi:hypothetical protein